MRGDKQPSDVDYRVARAKRFELGRKVADHLPRMASTLRPGKEDLASAAKALKLSLSEARKALEAFNFTGR